MLCGLFNLFHTEGLWLKEANRLLNLFRLHQAPNKNAIRLQQEFPSIVTVPNFVSVLYYL
jgi:hypothetical protein